MDAQERPMQAMPCEAVKRDDPGCCDCVVERTTAPFRFRLNAGGTPNTKTAAPERELFCFEWLCVLLFRLMEASQTMSRGWDSVGMSRSGGRRSCVSPGGFSLCIEVYP